MTGRLGSAAGVGGGAGGAGADLGLARGKYSLRIGTDSTLARGASVGRGMGAVAPPGAGGG